MKHWTHYRYAELQEKAGYQNFLSMGQGYSEWEQESKEDYQKYLDFTIYSPSRRMISFGEVASYTTNHGYRLEEAVLMLSTDFHHLDPWVLSFAYAEQYNVDQRELYAEFCEQEKNR